MAKSLGERIRELRELAGLSGGELAERAGLERSYVSKVERGERVRLSLATLAKLCDALDYSLAELVEDLGYVKDVSPDEASVWGRDVLRALEALPPDVRAMQIETLLALAERYESRRVRLEAEEKRQQAGGPAEGER